MSANGFTKEEVIDALHGIAAEMHDKMLKGDPPRMTLPVRTKQNIAFDKKLGVYKYGKKKSTRDATSLGSARQLLRALHVSEFIEEMNQKLSFHKKDLEALGKALESAVVAD